MLDITLSFASKVKNEVFHNRQFKTKNRFAQAYGLIMYGKHFTVDDISIVTENKPVAVLYCNMLYELTGMSGTVTLTESIKNNSTKTFTAYVDDSNDRINILNHFGNLNQRKINFDLLKNDSDINAFLSGAYLACGNISDPLKGYHLEFVISSNDLCIALSDLFFMMQIKHGIMKRRGQYVIYIKESEVIEDILTLIGAQNTAFELMNVKIYKEIRNKANRQTNCETANIDKTVKAASKQIIAIKEILQTKGIENIPADLKELALLRIENPDMSLRELGENHSLKLSKSAVNRRLEKLLSLTQNKNLEEL